ncbi:MobF family relaxase [Nocardioides marmoraquaticus]
MQGGVKFYRGAPGAARTYVEADRSRADDYYLGEGTGIARRFVAERAQPAASDPTDGSMPTAALLVVREADGLDGDAYEAWVAGFDPETGEAKGRLRTDPQALRFAEVVVNGPKTWSLAAALHSEIADAYDAAQDQAATEIISWLAEHATTRIGPRGRQVQVPIDALEAVTVRHYTSRAGDPHRHLHLQLNARVHAMGRWRGLHSVGIVDSIDAINGIGHAAMQCNPQFRQVLAGHGYHLDHTTGEILELAPHARAFSARAAQVAANIDRYEATWRREHPGTEPGPGLRRAWDRRAWAEARPDKVVPLDGETLARRWCEELTEQGFAPPVRRCEVEPMRAGSIDRDAIADMAVTRLGARRSAWNAADLRGEVERVLAAINVVTDPAARRELAEDATGRAVAASVPLLHRGDVPHHVRALTSPQVLAVEDQLIDRLTVLARGRTRDATDTQAPDGLGGRLGGHHTGSAPAGLDARQEHAVCVLAGTSRLVVVEGAAGAGKTTTLAALKQRLDHTRDTSRLAPVGGAHGDGGAVMKRRMVVVAPTLKAAQVAQQQIAVTAFSAAWLIHAHGHRWTEIGTRHRVPVAPAEVDPRARLRPGDLLVVDEAGMLDQDTALAILKIVEEAGARVALMGDRHQLPAVGRGGVLDQAIRAVHPADHVTSDVVHRFADPEYARLTLAMRTVENPVDVFNQLHACGRIVIHASDVERLAALADLGAAGETVIADTHAQVTALNQHIADLRHGDVSAPSDLPAAVAGRGGLPLRVGDQVATRRNDGSLGVANRDRWNITSLTSTDGSGGGGNRGGGVVIASDNKGTRTLPGDYVSAHLELAYATTVHGAQGDTVDSSHLLLGETTGSAAVYVAMTRGRHRNTAHLVAENVDDARKQWVAAATRNRADLGPAHAAKVAAADIERYGPLSPLRSTSPEPRARRVPERLSPRHAEGRRPRVGR